MLLILGLILFLSVHAVVATPARPVLVASLGLPAFKGAIGLLSLLGMILIGMGYADYPDDQWFQPLLAAQHAAILTMPVAFVLFVATYTGGKVKHALRHPQLWSVLLWSVTHLLSNGEAAASLLFGGFAIWSVEALGWHALYDGPRTAPAPETWRGDLLALGIGGTAFVAVFLSHAWIFGVPPGPLWG